MPELTVVVCVAFDHRSPPDGVSAFKECIYACPLVDNALEVVGTYDLIVHAHFDSLAHYNEQLALMAHPIRTFVAKYEANFVGRSIDRRRCTGGSLWLPVRDGRRQVSTNLIDKIEANGDYMNVFVGDWNCMVHDTIRHMCEQLDPEHFVQLHRSIIVRVDYIERLLHQNRRWIARLRDGTEQRVAKSHVADILRLIKADPATDRAHSSNISASTERLSAIAESHLNRVR